MKATLLRLAGIFVLLLASSPAWAGPARDDRFRPMDIFQLEYASDPQISPSGKQVVYVRNFMDVMKDRRQSNLWVINADGSEHRPITTGKNNDHSPAWSPDGKRLVYISRASGSPQLYCRWMDSGQTAKLTHVTAPPAHPVWSPDGKQIAFTMQVIEKPRPFVEMPAKPEGAEWADPPKVIRDVHYRRDGSGYLKEGRHQLFVVAAEGGAVRQMTDGPYDHRSPVVWAPDGKSLIFSANRRLDSDLDPLNTEIYEIFLVDRSIKALTNHKGPDEQPALSPDGKQIAFVGFDDQRTGYQAHRLYLMNRDGTGRKQLGIGLDRDLRNPVWNRDGSGVYVLHEEHGTSRITFVPLEGAAKRVVDGVGGVTIGRPYSSGTFSAAAGKCAFTLADPQRPADVAVVGSKGGTAQRLTNLNDNLLGQGNKVLGAVEEFWFPSSHDRRKIQGWIVKPPHFDPKKKYPLLLEIHGGPYANYGLRFSAEIQLYAAAGYVVLYVNPRGSTGYGEEFAQLINHNYPSQDYDDLMSGVDAVLARGFIDEESLFVTGGSGGGVLTAWIVGKTRRFRAAVSCKPVINWYSFALTADLYPFFTQYWFSAPPWEKPEEYHKRSPIALVGNVTTPTMILTGEADHRTPMSESEQYYQALKLRKVDTALVRIPGASHDISDRPSQMIAQVLHVLKWFEIHGKPKKMAREEER